MEWKQIADDIIPKKDLANNEEIKRKLESLSLYNSALTQLSDNAENNSEEQSAVMEKEDEVRKNTLSKILELQEQAKQAQSEEEKTSKLIECFLYMDNYLSLYAEPELFFVRDRDQDSEKVIICDIKTLLNSQKKFEDIIQCVFFFQELNSESHSSLKLMCRILNGGNADIMNLMGDMDFMSKQLDELNRLVFEHDEDSFHKQLYPFILLSNYTMQRIFLHNFAHNYPFIDKKSAFEKALKQKEPVLEKIKSEIYKYSETVKRLGETIFEPMYQEVQYNEKCIEIIDENIILKKILDENGNSSGLLNIIYDKTSQCCAASFWIAFLIANTKRLKPGEKNMEANKWLGFYFEIVKENKYDIYMSLHKYLNENSIYNAYSFNIVTAKLEEERQSAQQINQQDKKAETPKTTKIKTEENIADTADEPKPEGKKMPLWLVILIAAVLILLFTSLIFVTSKPLG